jgi:MoxR-like ATPase
MNTEELQIAQFKKEFETIESEISKAIIGQDNIIRNVLIAMVAGGNVLLEGLPGLGKTQLIKTIGKVMDLKFSRIQFTPDLMPADVTGTNILIKNKEGESQFQFQKGSIFSNIVLADEINRATPKTQSALLEAMQERTVTSGNTTYPLPEPFFVLATQNPLEMEGTYPLPEAQMDRFLFKLEVPFPKKDDLFQIMTMTTGNHSPNIKTICNGDTVLSLRRIAQEVPIAKPVADYILDLVLKSHPDYAESPQNVKKYVRYGSSPRGAQAILATAKITALLSGRYNVSYEDVKSVATSALRHRILLNFEGIAEGLTSDDIIQELLGGGSHGTLK